MNIDKQPYPFTTKGTIMLGDNYGHERVAAVDPVTSSLAVIEVDHGEIHAGRMWFIDDHIDLGNGQVYDIHFVCPSEASAKEAHLVWMFDFEAETQIQIFEDVVTSADGTAITAYNRKRDSLTTLYSSVFHTPTVTSTGTQLINKRLGSGKSFGGGARSNVELDLCCGKKYLFRFTNQTTADNLLNYQFDWYEVPKLIA